MVQDLVCFFLLEFKAPAEQKMSENITVTIDSEYGNRYCIDKVNRDST
jgi:hypothetical protein